MLHCWTILEEVSVWKANGPIHVCRPKINCQKSSAIDCKTRSVRKMQNCQTASWNQFGWKRKSVAINKVELGFGAHYSLSRLNEGGIITIDKTKKIQEGGTVFCRKHIEENFWQKSFYMWIC